MDRTIQTAGPGRAPETGLRNARHGDRSASRAGGRLDGRSARSSVGLAAGITLAVCLFAAPVAAQIIPGPAPEPETDRPDFEERPDIEEPTEEVNRSAIPRITTTLNARVQRSLVLESDLFRLRTREETPSRRPARRALGRDGEGGGEGGVFGLDGAFAAWSNLSVTAIDDDSTGAAFDGTLITPLAGVDYTIDGRTVLGLGLGYERADLDTAFNAGSLESDGFIISPYVGQRLGDLVVLDAGLAYTRLGYDRVRAEVERRSGSFDADRVLVFGNATGYLPPDLIGVEGLLALGQIGFGYSREEQEAFREDDGTRIPGGTVELGELTFGVEARYFPEVEAIAGLELFARAQGTYDVIRDERDEAGFAIGSDDRTDVTLRLGAVARVTERVSVDLAYEQVLLREDLTELAVTAGLRFDF